MKISDLKTFEWIENMVDTVDYRIAKFRNVLDSRREIKLVYNGERYKAKCVTKVLYSSERKNHCNHPNCGEAFSYVITVAGPLEIIFHITGSDACQGYFPATEFVEAFNSMQELERCLITLNEKEALKVLFPKALQENNTGSDTDSY